MYMFLNKWKTFSVHGLVRQYCYMAILPKEIYRVTAIPINIPLGLLAEIDKMTLRCIWHFKGSRISSVKI